MQSSSFVSHHLSPRRTHPASSSTMATFAASLLLFIVCLTTISLNVSAASAPLSTSMKVDLNGSQILVNGKPFFIKGVIYTPSPIGSHPAWTWPNGDFFIPQYASLWARDLPLLKEMGANTLRVQGWNNELDHGYFLDTAHSYGLKVIVTFSLSNAWSQPVQEEWQRQQHLGRFIWQFRKYLNHPALLAWSFGEQVNLLSNGFLQQFNDASSSRPSCGWNAGSYNPSDTSQGGCFNNPDSSSRQCAGAITCVYERFFNFLNQAAIEAKNIMSAQSHRGHLIMSSLSDVDLIWKRWSQFSYQTQMIDAWGLQIYRGKDFGQGDENFLRNYEIAHGSEGDAKPVYDARGDRISSTNVKPLIVVEYGVDAYADPCGKSTETPCYNSYDAAEEDESSQAEYGASLASLLSEHSSAHGKGYVAGGTINSYVDEAWRCAQGVAGCGGPIPYPLPGFDASQCAWKAHVSCPNLNLWAKSLCGFFSPASEDHYTNVAFFGIMRPAPLAGRDDEMIPRLLYGRLQAMWSRREKRWGWLILFCTSLVVTLGVTYYLREEYTKRKGQVFELEMRHSAMMNNSSGGGRSGGGIAAGSSRSPILAIVSTASPAPLSPSSKRGGGSTRSQPVGRSSRATSSATGGSLQSSPVITHTMSPSPLTLQHGGMSLGVATSSSRGASPAGSSASPSVQPLPMPTTPNEEAKS